MAPGPSFPRRDSPLLRSLGRGILRAMGWKIQGGLPELPRFVVIVAPHTSNWDFIVGMAAMFALDVKLSFLGKHTLFRGPGGPLLRAMGGIPVDRTASHGMVESAVAAFRRNDALVLAIAPEGTRKPVERLRSGFLHIARGAGVPILLASLDGAARCVRLGPVLDPAGDMEAQLASIERHYRGVRGWRAKRFPGTA
ncbi:MAG TPA: lysophospholipid acyltransferase family protein [Usitatibacter sp.]|jgi:1-acyl-sn-glycerol-3-phosphate acyltransferase|nr:lysophospholipid acyltransferase family protein [Usitatibacter sp.]